MENTIPVRQSRSLTRRLALPLCMSVATLAGAGWGVYHFTTSSAVDITAQKSETAHSAPDSNDSLKSLFAKQDPPATAPTTSKADRYSKDTTEPTTVLVAEETESADLEPADLATEAAVTVGDRYSPVSTPEPSAPEPTEVAETTPDQQTEEMASLEPTSQDIARGQEPNANPLRSAPESLDKANDRANDIDAQTAFGQTAPTAKPLSAAPQALAGANPFAKSVGTAPAALENANPLPPQNSASQSNTRYGTAQPKLAAPPANSFNATNAEQFSQGPAPAFDIEQPQTARQPMRQELATATAAPLGAQLGTMSDSITPTPGLTSRTGTGSPGEQLLEGEQSPSITIHKLAPEEIQVNKRCTFAIRVQNTGQRTVQNVQIHDEVPKGTELVGTAPRAAVSGSTVVWDLGTLSVGEERIVEMELLPKEEGELGSVATVTMATQASAKARCTRPELALRLSCNSQVLEGQQHVVQIEISNPGSGEATNVMLLANLPPSVSHEAGPALEYEIGTLSPGETRQMELMLTAEQAGQINSKMIARADANLRVEENCEFEIIAPELQLTIDGPQRRYLERPATYQINVGNPGTATAHEIQLVTRLPKGLQFVSANNLGEYDSSTHSVRWSLAELPANERGSVELVALPVEAGDQVIQATTTAGPSLEDRTEKTVVVEGLAALTFEVTDQQGLIEVGGETTYEIVVTNKGSKAAANVQVVAIMPAGMQALSAQGETRHAIQGERVTFSPLPQLAPKAETIFRIQARGIRPGDQRVRVQIVTDELKQPITKEVNTRVYADE